MGHVLALHLRQSKQPPARQGGGAMPVPGDGVC